MKNFGKNVREHRRALGLTREEFCGDESLLSVRQLTRIEQGVSSPTLEKVDYISSRLGVPIGELTNRTFELPEEYKELKSLLLRTQTYMDPERVALREHYLTAIFDHYYDELPEEEQLIVDIFQSHLEMVQYDNLFSTEKILADYIEQVLHKSVYTTNDLIFLELYLDYMTLTSSCDDGNAPHQRIVNHLLEQEQLLSGDAAVVFNNVLISALGSYLYSDCSLTINRLMAKIETVMIKTQDFQKMPILNLLRWKYALKQDDQNMAHHYYKDAVLFANLIQDTYLVEMLEKEWQKEQIFL